MDGGAGDLVVEDTVRFRIFRAPQAVNNRGPITPGDCTAVALLVHDLAHGYLWHHEPPAIALVPAAGAVPTHLAGAVRYGDAVDDEWFVVHLLAAVSSRLDDLVVSVTDNDGDFLLIEAADDLPRWLDPSTSTNRVFLHRGRVHIIPMPRTANERAVLPESTPPLELALRIVADPAIATTASTAIQEHVDRRTGALPSAISTQKHRSRVLVPHRVAHMLACNPQLVSHAVDAFVTRDPLAMRPCHTMRSFPPASNVAMTVTMTKIMYAQLQSQRMHPLPPFRLPPRSSPDFAAVELGMKLACGFEMLYNSLHLRNTSAKSLNQQTIETYNFEADPQWRKLRARLNKAGYFRGELEGSQAFVLLERAAKQQHLNATQTDRLVATGNVFDEMERLLNEIPLTPENQLPRGPPESDAWMYIDPRDMDRDLEMRSRSAAKPNDDAPKGAAKRQAPPATQPSGSESNDDSDGASADLNEEELAELDNMKQIFQGFESFVGKESGLSGALFPNQSDEDDEDDEERDEGDDAQGIHLDPQSFLEHVMSVLSMGDDSRKPSNLPSSSRQATGNGAAENLLNPASPSSGSPRRARPVDSDDEDDFDSEHEAVYDTELQRYMDLMDRELFSTKIAGDFERERPAHLAERPGSNSEPDDGDESDDSDDDFQPVDLDANLVKNALESFEAQQGLAGPVSNIILSLGLRLPTPQRDSQPSGRTDRAMNR
ncbi:hypothetical protein HK105_200133 [Polyrhizophydium stewartii]|uniref:Uncharacterized protein n=1 Tax=Polyrhizophydium stewartii TaxID=2732419 RepID=A0ABR4NKM0_9FUNG